MLLVLRALKLGDLLVAVPALHALRRAYPGHRLLYAAQGWLEDAVGLVGGFELLPTHGLDVPLALEPARWTSPLTFTAAARRASRASRP